MPWKSKAQQRWGNSPTGKKALGGQGAVDEWNQATDFTDLPEQAKSKRKAQMKQSLKKKPKP